MQLPLDHLKSLLETLEEGGVSEFEYEDEKVRVKVALARGQAPVVSAVAPVAMAAVPAPAPSSPRASEATDPNVVFVTSPFVGTFYRAPSPESEDFVAVNGSVKKGQTLCIIEAMKLMNEIDSEYDGEVVNIYVENGQPVQYGERLFAMRTR
jgi:acetyl-CoA carboxylase biotin carboxyl carrier protein